MCVALASATWGLHSQHPPNPVVLLIPLRTLAPHVGSSDTQQLHTICSSFEFFDRVWLCRRSTGAWEGRPPARQELEPVRLVRQDTGGPAERWHDGPHAYPSPGKRFLSSSVGAATLLLPLLMQGLLTYHTSLTCESNFACSFTNGLAVACVYTLPYANGFVYSCVPPMHALI